MASFALDNFGLGMVRSTSPFSDYMLMLRLALDWNDFNEYIVNIPPLVIK